MPLPLLLLLLTPALADERPRLNAWWAELPIEVVVTIEDELAWTDEEVLALVTQAAAGWDAEPCTPEVFGEVRLGDAPPEHGVQLQVRPDTAGPWPDWGSPAGPDWWEAEPFGRLDLEGTPLPVARGAYSLDLPGLVFGDHPLSPLAIVGHELGHVAGLGHTCDEGEACLDPAHRQSLMYWVTNDTEVPTELDLLGLRRLYGPRALLRCGEGGEHFSWQVPFELECHALALGMDEPALSWTGPGLSEHEGATATFRFDEPTGGAIEFCAEGITPCGTAKRCASVWVYALDPSAPSAEQEAAEACGCSAPAGPAGTLALLGALGLAWRRRADEAG